jgi:hypothetical protein
MGGEAAPLASFSDPAYARHEMEKPETTAPPEDEQHIEQRQADDRREKDKSEKVERDRADAAGRRAREGT